MVIWKYQGETPQWKDVKHEDQLVKILWSMWKFIYLEDGILYKAQSTQSPLRSFWGEENLTQCEVETLVAWNVWWCLPLVLNLRSMSEEEPKVQLQNATSPTLSRFTYGANGNRYPAIQGTDWKWKHLCFSIGRLLHKWTEDFALPDHQALTVADILVTEVFQPGPKVSIWTYSGYM